MNTNGDGKAGDPFWENSERMLYTALIALLRDWFPPEDYNLPGLLTLLSMAEARENDENYKSPLDLLFLQIEEGRRYMPNGGGEGAQQPTASRAASPPAGTAGRGHGSRRTSSATRTARNRASAAASRPTRTSR